MTAVPRTDLGLTTSLEVIDARVPLAGRRVLDVGCGGLAFSRQLLERGAEVLAVDPDPAVAARHRAAPPPAGIVFASAAAEALPADDRSVDAVFFSFSLHHVPAAAHASALGEVRRVLRPDGVLCVVEPAGGPLNEVMRLFDDEEAERAAAQAALLAHAAPAFRRHAAFRYHSLIEYASFEDFARRHGRGTDPGDAGARSPWRPEVAAAFERAGAPAYRFPSFKVMDLFEGPRTP